MNLRFEKIKMKEMREAFERAKAYREILAEEIEDSEFEWEREALKRRLKEVEHIIVLAEALMISEELEALKR